MLELASLLELVASGPGAAPAPAGGGAVGRLGEQRPPRRRDSSWWESFST